MPRIAALLLTASLAFASCGSGTDMVADDVLDRPFQLGDGGTTTIAELHAEDGRPIVVNLWATWCAPCLAEMPDLQAFHQQRGDEVRVLGLNITDSPTRSDARVEELGITYLLGRDPEGAFTAALGAVGLPVTAFVDSAGTLAHVHQGPLDLELLDELAAEHR